MEKLNELKEQIKKIKLKTTLNIKHKYNSLVVSFGEFQGYDSIVDMSYIVNIIDAKEYDINHLHGNELEIKSK